MFQSQIKKLKKFSSVRKAKIDAVVRLREHRRQRTRYLHHLRWQSSQNITFSNASKPQTGSTGSFGHFRCTQDPTSRLSHRFTENDKMNVFGILQPTSVIRGFLRTVEVHSVAGATLTFQRPKLSNDSRNGTSPSVRPPEPSESKSCGIPDIPEAKKTCQPGLFSQKEIRPGLSYP